MPKDSMTRHCRENFLKILKETCNVSEAARLSGISRSTLYATRQTNPDFAKEWEEAEQEALDKLEHEAWKRAVDGIEKPIIYRGQVTDSYREYSDRMLEILLRAHRPDKFKRRMVNEVTGKEDVASEMNQNLASNRIAEILDRIEAALNKK